MFVIRYRVRQDRENYISEIEYRVAVGVVIGSSISIDKAIRFQTYDQANKALIPIIKEAGTERFKEHWNMEKFRIEYVLPDDLQLRKDHADNYRNAMSIL